MKLPVADGAAGTFDHVSQVYFEGNKRHFLTHGQHVVTKILAYRQDLHTLWVFIVFDTFISDIWDIFDTTVTSRQR